MVRKGYKCYNYHCNGRVGDSPLCGWPGDTALTCQNRIVSPVTNADRIRAMSDDELAEFIFGIYDVEEDQAKFINDVYILHCSADDIKFWLQQPAEEIANGTE